MYSQVMRLSFLWAVLVILSLTSCIGSQKRAPVMHYGHSQGAGSAGVHTVVAGDTLWSISKRYNIVMRDIAVSNKLGASFALSVGQRLRLPPPQTYKVRSGDSLYSVSRLFGVNIPEISSLNNLREPYVIREGQSLRLPSVARKTTVLSNIVRPKQKPYVGKVMSPSSKPLAHSIKNKTPSKKKTKITAKTPKRSSSKFLRPVDGKIISSYGSKKSSQHNDGINIRSPKGTPVRVAENGVVVYAGSELKGSGNLVLVRHDGRFMTAYAHMDRMLIQRGQTVRRGQSIGTVGSTGSVDFPQLHFEVRRGTEAINPVKYLE